MNCPMSFSRTPIRHLLAALTRGKHRLMGTILTQISIKFGKICMKKPPATCSCPGRTTWPVRNCT
ncbi:hypothetical protein METSCH_E03460 [Metschnikowia aff. pulcherrima]|uniref:Uncharacterized protein n=1 Tax=Metschnikowia aff. pulcherrima TaxID=2163413 RepID=A0A4P6XUE3_9ASCO|nr:hypothetical protein METSCH_E03460 [Metschnikowia aff. pulcherrima]